MIDAKCHSERALLRTPKDQLTAEQLEHLRSCSVCGPRWRSLADLAEACKQFRSQELDDARARSLRAAIVTRADAGGTSPPGRRWVPVAAVAAAAAVLALWMAPRWWRPVRPRQAASSSTAPRYRGHVDAQPGARVLRVGGSPDEIVRLFEGKITVQVHPLAPGERFRVMTEDAEVEVRGTAFEVVAERDQLRSVWVLHGVVSVSGPALEAPVWLHAGERWERPPELRETAVAEDVLGPANSAPLVSASSRARVPNSSGTSPGPVRAPTPRVAPLARASRTAAPRPTRRRRARRGSVRGDDEPLTPAAVDPVRAADSRAPAASESAFETGWTALRGGNFSAAAQAFASAASDETAPLAEDAAYWQAVALARAGRGGEATAALERFLRTYPASQRSGEAHAMLGWERLRDGDATAARQHFEAALEGSERSRRSAERGLARLEHSRSRPTR